MIYSHDCSWWSCSVSQVFFIISFRRERERERRERESEKKKIGGRGENTFCLSKIPPKNKKEEREEFWFLIPAGRSHFSSYFKTLSERITTENNTDTTINKRAF